MKREEFAELLKKIRAANEDGGCIENIDEILRTYSGRNVYIYNDACIKKILASKENVALTTDLVNAALDLQGNTRIEAPVITNPYIPGELGFKSVEPDVLLRKEHPVFCGTKPPDDIISIEVQHNGSSIFVDRLMLYVARHTSRMVPPNDMRPLDNLNVISFQLFNTYSWKVCKDYRYTVQMKTQNNLVYFNKQTVTLVEVNKFLKYPEYFKDDNSRLAQWLRAIDALNREDEAAFEPFAEDPIFRDLQKSAKLCNFNSEYLLKESRHMTDIAYEKYVAAEEGRAMGLAKGLVEGRAKGRAEGRAEGRADATRKYVENALRDKVLTVEQIAKYNEVSVSYVCEVQKEIGEN